MKKFLCAAMAALVVFSSFLVQGQDEEGGSSKYQEELGQLEQLRQDAMLLRLASELEARRLAILQMAETQARAQGALERAIALHKKQVEELAAAREAVAAAEAALAEAQTQAKAEKSKASEFELALALEREATKAQKEREFNLGLAAVALAALCAFLACCLLWRRRE